MTQEDNYNNSCIKNNLEICRKYHHTYRQAHSRVYALGILVVTLACVLTLTFVVLFRCSTYIDIHIPSLHTLVSKRLIRTLRNLLPHLFHLPARNQATKQSSLYRYSTDFLVGSGGSSDHELLEVNSRCRSYNQITNHLTKQCIQDHNPNIQKIRITIRMANMKSLKCPHHPLAITAATIVLQTSEPTLDVPINLSFSNLRMQ